MTSPTLPLFVDSQRRYEDWLSSQSGKLREDDLETKHDKMRHSPFVFLRATYWRWAEAILTVCSELAGAPSLPAVGDIHVENFGVWRDRDGRLVWGVNDFDEAAEMPYVLDIVRLGTSAFLARAARRSKLRAICSNVLAGYGDGLSDPKPFALDEEHVWLRSRLAVSDAERAKFWKKIRKLAMDRSIPERYRRAIQAQMPAEDVVIEKYARRSAGTGSLGRPRWIGVAEWRGGRVIREAKAIVASGWTLAHPSRHAQASVMSIVSGRYRAPDPWYRVIDGIVVRRLSPNARKIEAEDHPRTLGDRKMLHAMGRELANVHLGLEDMRKAIATDLARRDKRWLERATDAAATFVLKDFADYRASVMGQ